MGRGRAPLCLLLLGLLPRVVLAQAAAEPPSEDWAQFPGERAAAISDAPAAPPAPTPAPERDRAILFGADTVRPGHFAVGLFAGFPFLGAHAAYGLLPRLEAGLAFESLYGSLNDVRTRIKWQLSEHEWLRLALVAEGGPAFFLVPSQSEVKGARWLTGRRDWNLAPGVIATFQPATFGAPRLIVDLRWHVALDTEPHQVAPLGGLPPAVQVSHNAAIHFGAELLISQGASLVAVLGFELHGRPEDIPVMPLLAVGFAAVL